MFEAALRAGNPWHWTPSAWPQELVSTVQAARVPIRALGPSNCERISRHLLALDAADRYLRFGHAASDAQIERYVERIDFERDQIFGIHNRRLELIALAHLAYPDDLRRDASVEFGVSVLPHARGRGYGTRLFDRAVVHARNDGVKTLFIHALSENTAMLTIARNAGARVQRDGPESDAYLQLPAPDSESRVSELLEQQYAELDYQLKLQAKAFWDSLTVLPKLRGCAASDKKRPLQ